MKNVLGLTLEQEFNLARYREEAKDLPREELIELLMDAIRQGMAKDNFLREELTRRDFPLY